MMFLRFLILIGIFSVGALTAIYPYLLIMSAVAAGTAWFLHSRWKRPAMSETVDEDEDGSNPLEFKVALIFAVLFVVFTIATHYTLIYAGEGGLTLLSFVSGFSDITPFILNLLQGYGQCACFIDNSLQHAGDSKQHCRKYVLCIVLLRQEESVAFVGVERLGCVIAVQLSFLAVVFLLSVNQCAFRFF